MKLRAGDYERDRESGLLLPRHARRGAVLESRAHPQFMCGPAFFGGASSDPYFSSVGLLLHGNGVNGSTTFTDSSGTPKTVTQAGGASISTAQSKWGGSSIANTTASHLTVPTNSAFDFGTGNFTIEFWVYLNSAAGDIYFLDREGAGNGFRLELFSGSINFFSNATTILNAAWAPATATWIFMQLLRSGTTVSITINGSTLTSATYSSALNTGGLGLRIGNFGAPGNFGVNGYFDDFRITNGVARPIAVPTAQFPDS